MKKKKTSKKRYRVRNWLEYNKALKNRGDITIWFSDAAIAGWASTKKTGKPGSPETYSDLAMTTILTLKMVYRLGYRQVEGFVCSLVKLMGLDLIVPCSTQINRRSKKLHVEFAHGRKRKSEEELHVVIDSTGVKVYGEGEWKVRQHGLSKRRTWRKLHVAVDGSTGEILASSLTENSVDDASVLPELVDLIDEEIDQVSADGAYDKRKVYTALAGRGARGAIPPQKKAKIWRHGNQKGPPHIRDENLRSIRKQGRKAWKEASGYHRRSIAENTMYRYKAIFGDRLASREFAHQAVEVFIKCSILNRMNALGMPESYVLT